jgi:hypothetical protein
VAADVAVVLAAAAARNLVAVVVLQDIGQGADHLLILVILVLHGVPISRQWDCQQLAASQHQQRAGGHAQRNA